MRLVTAYFSQRREDRTRLVTTFSHPKGEDRTRLVIPVSPKESGRRRTTLRRGFTLSQEEKDHSAQRFLSLFLGSREVSAQRFSLSS